eukprot:TRINITY_DN5630_c0_g1_i2.p4 TRINITY_DN5630_c0_g1~~TRINITY_DN5630_c0_g1_i2.p4  ORF type:complete len:138 (-),score=7.38 TRINITY_DN5630_c0_g1_i2:162-515(-)
MSYTCLLTARYLCCLLVVLLCLENGYAQTIQEYSLRGSWGREKEQGQGYDRGRSLLWSIDNNTVEYGVILLFVVMIGGLLSLWCCTYSLDNVNTAARRIPLDDDVGAKPLKCRRQNT